MKLDKDTVYIFTDGSCYPNPGEGGWAALLIYNQYKKIVYGSSEGLATNNSMELRAILEGLRELVKKTGQGVSHITPTVLYTDSKYCIDALTTWWPNWERKGWLTGKGAPVKNKSIIQDIVRIKENAEFRWVAGHTGNIFNELVDRMAGMGRVGADAYSDKSAVALILDTVDIALMANNSDISADEVPFYPCSKGSTTPEVTVDTPCFTAENCDLKDILAGMYFVHNVETLGEETASVRGYRMANRFIELYKE